MKSFVLIRIIRMRHLFRRCVKKFNQINEYSFYVCFLWSVLAVSSLLVTLQFLSVECKSTFANLLINNNHFSCLFLKWANETNLVEVMLLLLVLIWLIFFIFLMCESGGRMTNQFVVFSNELSRCNWISLSIKMRRMYLVFLLDSQNPMKIRSYANITCERKTFKKVVWFQQCECAFSDSKFLFSDYQSRIFILHDNASIQSINDSHSN